jgi:hypothetical protein
MAGRFALGRTEQAAQTESVSEIRLKSNNSTEKDAMNHKRLLPQMAGLTLAILFVVACGTLQPTSTPVASPTPIPGIDEPLTVRTYKVRVLEAYPEDGTLVVVTEESGITPTDYIDLWCTDGRHKVFKSGIQMSADGAALLHIFRVPEELELDKCSVRLYDDWGNRKGSIDLAFFFEP